MRRNAAKILQINCQKVSGKERGMREGCREGGEGYTTPPATLAQEQQRERERAKQQFALTNFEPIVWLWQCVRVCVCVCVSGVCVCQLCVCECVCLLTRMRWVPQLALKIITLADLLSVARPKRKCSPPPSSCCYPTSPLLTCLLPSAGCCKWAATLRLQRRHIVTVTRHHLRSPQQLVELATSPCGVEMGKRRRTDGGIKKGEAKEDKGKSDWLSWAHGVMCCLTFHCFPSSNWVEIEVERSKASRAARREDRKRKKKWKKLQESFS